MISRAVSAMQSLSASPYSQYRTQSAQRSRSSASSSSPIFSAPRSPDNTAAVQLMPSKWDDADRLVKYGWGTVRLGCLLSIMLRVSGDAMITGPYRWLTYLAMGAFGACVNVEALGDRAYWKTFLLGVMCCCFLGDLRYDVVCVMWLSKTLIPDMIAGKIDTPFWRLILAMLVLFIAVSLSTPSSFVSLELHRYGLLLWSVHAVAQLVCELGDQHLEDMTFFRHRWSYELSCIVIYLLFPLSQNPIEERRILYFDMISCLAYRATNVILKRIGMDKRS